MAAETECEKFARWLSDLEQVEQDLVAGAQAVSIQSGASNKAVTFTAAELPEVRRRVYQLRKKVADCNGTSYNVRRIIHTIPTDG
jgi:hypothetical protein